MTKLFTTVSEKDRKIKVIHFRVSANDAEIITASAKARNLSEGDFIRRAALGRRADVRYETHIIWELRAVIKAICTLHAAVVDRGILPPESEWGPVIDEAVTAMQRISK